MVAVAVESGELKVVTSRVRKGLECRQRVQGGVEEQRDRL